MYPETYSNQNMPKQSAKFFYSGLSGLQLDIPKHLYPPPFENASRLTYYSAIFNSIEFNSSFYKIPKESTVINWMNLVSQNFKFTFKLWKEITHCKGLDFREEDISLFFKSINSVELKKGCLLIQFPPSIGINSIFQLEKLLTSIKETDGTHDWNIAIEFRNKSWYHESVYNLINSFNATVVIHDIPKSATPYLKHNSDFIYIRFHGPTGNYRDSYSDDFLHEYSTYINEWIDMGKKVFIYFNNTMGDAFNNLKTLNSLVYRNIGIKNTIH